MNHSAHLRRTGLGLCLSLLCLALTPSLPAQMNKVIAEPAAASTAPSDGSTTPPPATSETKAQAPSATPAPAAALAAPAKTTLTTKDAVILGLVEGITEFLPISSTGHLIIANELLGLESDAPLFDSTGKPLYYKKPSEKNPAGEPLTVKLAADTYTVVIQVGAIAAVALLYWAQILGILKGLIGRDPEGLELLRNIACAMIPVCIIGLLSTKWIDAHLFSVQAVIVAQISGAVLMIYAERWRKARSNLRDSHKEPSDLSVPEATGIGAMQCLALWPGTSRSMVTIVGGYFMGLRPAKAAEFSFLVGLPVLAGAALVKGYKSGAAMFTVFGWQPVLIGIIVAALSAAIAVKFLVAFLNRFGLLSFAIYRLLLAGLLCWYFFA